MSGVRRRFLIQMMTCLLLLVPRRGSSSTATLAGDQGGRTKGQLLAEAVTSILKGGGEEEEKGCALLQYGMGDRFQVILAPGGNFVFETPAKRLLLPNICLLTITPEQKVREATESFRLLSASDQYLILGIATHDNRDINKTRHSHPKPKVLLKEQEGKEEEPITLISPMAKASMRIQVVCGNGERAFLTSAHRSPLGKINLLRKKLCSYDAFYTGKALRVAVGLLLPPLVIRDPSNGTIVGGATVKMLDDVMAHIKPNINFYDLPFGVYANSTQSFENFDMYILGRHYYNGICDQSAMLFKDEFVIIGRAPQPMPRIRNLINPFSAMVWIMVVMSTISVFLILVVISFIEKGKFKISNALLLTLSILLVEHKLSYLNNTLSPTLILKTIWVVTCLFLGLAYQSDLKAHLTYRPYTKPLVYMQDIVDRDVTLYAAKTGHDLMLPPAKEIDQILYDHIAKTGTTYDLFSPERPLQILHTNVKEEGAAMFFMKSFTLGLVDSYVRRREDFPFRNVEESYSISNFVLCYPKYRYWRGEPKLASDLRRMFDTGALEHVWSIYFPYEKMASSDSNTHPGQNKDEPIGLEALYLALALVLASFVVAVAAFLCELCSVHLYSWAQKAFEVMLDIAK